MGEFYVILSIVLMLVGASLMIYPFGYNGNQWKEIVYVGGLVLFTCGLYLGTSIDNHNFNDKIKVIEVSVQKIDTVAQDTDNDNRITYNINLQ